MTLLVLALACASPKGLPPSSGAESPTEGHDGVVVPPEPTGGPATREFLEPSARILTTDEFWFGGWTALVPAHGADPGLILSQGWDPSGDYQDTPFPALVLSGAVPPGDHEVTEVWDGVSRIDEWWTLGAVGSAGDVDHDGHLDLWFHGLLIRGPILGHQITPESDRVLATLDREYTVAADFDADGDGELDAIVQPASGNQAFVRYGPFSGAIPSASEGEADPATYSSLGESLGCLDITRNGRWLRDHLGPGHDAIAIGLDVGACSHDTYIWDPFVPPGTHLTYDDALAVLTHFPTAPWDVFVHDPGDVDQDGHPDVIYEYGSGAQVIPGPVDGLYDSFTDLGFSTQMQNGYPRRAMGDVNGDGARELVAHWYWDDPDSTRPVDAIAWVLMCSPFEFPLDFSKGIPLAYNGRGMYYMSSFIGLDSVDLDGDGLPELVNTRPGRDPEGLEIWYGTDLAAACAAHQDENTR